MDGTRCVTTLSWTENEVTELPTEMTVPAPSEPGTTCGEVMSAFSPWW